MFDDYYAEISITYAPPDFDQLERNYDQQIRTGFKALGREIEQLWHSKAAMTLHTSLEEYLKAIKVDTVDGDIDVSLEGSWLANAVEHGHKGFNMVPGFLAAGKNKIKFDRGPVHGKPWRGVKAGQTWWHPGIQARAIFPQVKNEVMELDLGRFFAFNISHLTV